MAVGAREARRDLEAGLPLGPALRIRLFIPELITWMKEQAGLKSVPVIIMTSLPETSVRARAEGFAAYLQKPFMIDDIAEAVARHLPPQRAQLRS